MHVIILKRTEVGERQSIARKGVRAKEGWKATAGNGQGATETSVWTPGLWTNQCEHAKGLAETGNWGSPKAPLL